MQISLIVLKISRLLKQEHRVMELYKDDLTILVAELQTHQTELCDMSMGDDAFDATSTQQLFERASNVHARVMAVLNAAVEESEAEGATKA